ncbi:SAM-dependent methyltransferase [Shewanella sp. 5_MG-2023]|uniref:SAM-dependent methyltransferase n=1 Tax=unclassified Shewanella TaxID=196818 RepID=UPI0026E3F252|nr:MULTISPECIES: SAM-dependent methyltransferase [unclassified Shewanella]MDO6617755.1 SAM-dependent methyltransferase [Shewanella sp. 6_MG-2023]MDO6639078.1 SAM-dependent methyltransferase [Shewanella sp. 5_MG-2023]
MNGSLVCVGLGMTLGAHICPISKSHIDKADVVFSGVSNGIVELWLKEMHPDVRSLQVFYDKGKSRHITYKQMVDAMLEQVRAGKKVVGAFYGHPGVFAQAPHVAIEQAKQEGFAAKMIPGISAEDCLYADLGIDPGRVGCQHFEASQFMFYQRKIDASAYLVLWQVGVAGDKSLERLETGQAHKQLLVELLLETYPADHSVILYEAAVLPIDKVRQQHIPVNELAQVAIHQHTTLVIPPSESMKVNTKLQTRLLELEAQLSHHQAS